MDCLSLLSTEQGGSGTYKAARGGLRGGLGGLSDPATCHGLQIYILCQSCLYSRRIYTSLYEHV